MTSRPAKRWQWMAEQKLKIIEGVRLSNYSQSGSPVYLVKHNE